MFEQRAGLDKLERRGEKEGQPAGEVVTPECERWRG
jgi:hypothetical protein